MTVAENNPKPLFDEWKALSSTDEVLFFNKKTKRLESMAYSNAFTRFFKIIWYYLSGCTRDNDQVFQGMSQLIKRSLAEIRKEEFTEEESLTEFLRTVKKVNDIALGQMITSFNENGEVVLSLAAEHLKLEIHKILDRMESKKENEDKAPPSASPPSSLDSSATILAPPPPISSTNQDLSPPTSAHADPILPPLSENLSPPPSPSLSSPPPPPPPLMSPEELKKQNIENTMKEIKTKKRLVEYLELGELQNTKEYKEYNGAKHSVKIYEEKVQDQQEAYKKVPLVKIDEAIEDIERQLKEIGSNKTVAIRQEGVLKEYSIEVAVETLNAWKETRQEIVANEAALSKYLAIRDEKRKAKVPHPTLKLTCEGLEKKLHEMEKELAKEIESNQGKMDLKTQNGLLASLETKLSKLQGKPVLVKKSTSGKISPPLLQKSLSMKESQGDLAAHAQKIAAEKKDAKPSILKL